MKMNAGVWIGIVAGLGALIFAVGTTLVNGGSLGIYIASGIVLMFGGMFYLFYKLFFAQMILANRLRKTGIAGKAVIREVRDTGVTINNNPQIKLVLDVKNSFGQVYTATVRTLISRLQPQMYQVGMTIAVLIDPKDENKIVVDYSGGKQSSRADTSFSESSGESQLKDELTRDQNRDDAIKLTGKSARAIVKKYTWLGININGNNPYAEIELEVMPADAPAFAAKVKAAIQESSVSKYQPGNEIFVKYDAYDLTKVALDHS